jgi:glutamyl-Q tRNA(Asp) synthetase
LAVTAGDEASAVAALLETARFLDLGIGQADSLDAFWREAIPAWGRVLDRHPGAAIG